MIDISHESLMRIWVRLKNWVDDEAEAVQMYTRLAEAASMYQVGKAGLWRPPDLQLALNWQAKHKPTLVWGQRYHPAFERTLVFLEYSKKEWETEQRIKELEQKRKLQRARRFALILGTATVISIIFLVFAFYQKSEADKQRAAAEVNLKRADSLRTISDVARVAAVKAKEEAEEAQKAEAEQRLLAEKAEKEAVENAELARQNAIQARENAEEAKRNAAIAQENEKEAKQQKELADRNAAEALRQRYIAQAKAMAVKSKELNDREQEGLIAQQAYKFNAEHQGYIYDNDIYNGLYAALKKV